MDITNPSDVNSLAKLKATRRTVC